MLLEKPVAVDYAQSLRLVDAVARLHGRLLVGHHRRHHPAIARARAAIRDGELGAGRRRQRALVGSQGGRVLHRHAVAPRARRRRHAHQRRARSRSAASPVRRGRRDPGDAELARARPRGRGHGVAEPQVRKRRGRQLPRLRRRRLAVGLGPVHRGDPRVPVPPGRRRLSARRHARRAVGAQPREVLVRPVGVCRLALAAVAHLPAGRAARVVPGAARPLRRGRAGRGGAPRLGGGCVADARARRGGGARRAHRRDRRRGALPRGRRGEGARRR